MPDEMSGQPPAEDDFDRQLRELTEGSAGAARYREPSAAERAKAAEQRRKQAKAQARENRRARRKVRRATARRRAVKAASWTIAIAILAGAGLLGWHTFGHKTGSAQAGSQFSVIASQSVASAAAASPPLTIPGTNPLAGNPAAGPGTDPFAGTPADPWASGAAGITIPVAAPHGPFTASEVAAAYATTQKLLIAAYLDPATLRGGAPTAFDDLLTAQQRQGFIANLNNTVPGKNGQSDSPRWVVASFAPGTTTLIGNVIKVHGTMTSREATDQGRTVLDVDVNYHFVYPVEPPHDPAAWMRVVLQIGGYLEFADWQGSGGPLQPWVELRTFRAGADCGTTDGYIHPDFSVSPPGKVRPSWAPVDPYSSTLPSMSPKDCRRTTGT